MYGRASNRNIKSACRNLPRTPSTRQRLIKIVHRRTNSNKDAEPTKKLLTKRNAPLKQITPLVRKPAKI